MTTNHRITQTTLNRLAAKIYEDRGWKILYQDMPGGSRSGVGLTALINSAFERTYNMIPDLVAAKDNVLLLGEVDVSLTRTYIGKFEKYASRANQLTQLFVDMQLFATPPAILFSFVASRHSNQAVTVPVRLTHFELLVLDTTQTQPSLRSVFLKD